MGDGEGLPCCVTLACMGDCSGFRDTLLDIWRSLAVDQ